MPFLRKSASSSSSPGLTLDVFLGGGDEQCLDRASLAVIVADLVKNLLQQRNQIPLTYQALTRDLERCRRQQEQEVAASTSGLSVAPPNGRRSAQRALLQQRTLRQRFVRQTEHFVNALDTLLAQLTDEITSESAAVSCVSILLGATPVTPKEVFHVYLPPRGEGRHDAATAQSAYKRASVRLFRSILTHEQFFTQIGRPLRPTNLYIAIKKSVSAQGGGSRGFACRPQFGNLRRGQVTIFRLHHGENRPAPATAARPPARRRVRYSSVALDADENGETPYRSSNVDVALTPVPMDLCTPAPSAAALRRRPADLTSVQEETPLRPPICIEMLETPCAASSASETPSARDTADDFVCTPLFERNVARPSSERQNPIREEEEEAARQIDVMSLSGTNTNEEWFVSNAQIKGFLDPRLK